MNINSECKIVELFSSINELLESEETFAEKFDSILKQVALYFGVSRIILTILNREKNEIFVEAGTGFEDNVMQRGRYKPGEGITGKVVDSGKSIIVPRISEEPHFLGKLSAEYGEGDYSFICTPIIIEKEVIGTLSMFLDYQDVRDLSGIQQLLLVIGHMLARHVRLHQLHHEEKEMERLASENLRLKDVLRKRYKPENIIGNSKAMHEVYDYIEKIAPAATSVLILGESGVGKELVAHSIHYKSPRAGKPFIKINCAALPEHIIESELFGHERGAFTGASDRRKGRFELADGGSIFLDEVGELSLQAQVKLLRVIQYQTFERIGGVETLNVNVRIIAATNQNLEELIGNGKFREDLFYRLNVFPILVPPLRERKSDIMLLADFFVEKYARENNKRVLRISTPAIDMLHSYHWPGNVRELEQHTRSILLTGTCHPSKAPEKDSPSSRLQHGIDRSAYSAEDILSDYCKLLYERFGTYEEVAKRAQVDRRTAKKYILM